MRFSKKRKLNTDVAPPVSDTIHNHYMLIILTLMSAKDEQLSRQQICTSITETYPSIKKENPNLDTAVKNTLENHFIRVKRPGGYWSIDCTMRQSLEKLVARWYPKTETQKGLKDLFNIEGVKGAAEGSTFYFGIFAGVSHSCLLSI